MTRHLWVGTRTKTPGPRGRAGIPERCIRCGARRWFNASWYQAAPDAEPQRTAPPCKALSPETTTGEVQP